MDSKSDLTTIIQMSEAYRIYLAAKLHFTTNYDAVKSKGKVKNLTPKDNEISLLKMICRDLKTRRDLVEYCVANHLYGNKNFLYQNKELSDNNYNRWIKIKESLNYTVQKDLGYLELNCLKKQINFEDYLKYQLISDLYSSRIEYETIIVLAEHDESLYDKILGYEKESIVNRLKKASKFVQSGNLSIAQLQAIRTFLATFNNSIEV